MPSVYDIHELDRRTSEARAAHPRRSHVLEIIVKGEAVEGFGRGVQSNCFNRCKMVHLCPTSTCERFQSADRRPHLRVIPEATNRGVQPMAWGMAHVFGIRWPKCVTGRPVRSYAGRLPDAGEG